MDKENDGGKRVPVSSLLEKPPKEPIKEMYSAVGKKIKEIEMSGQKMFVRGIPLSALGDLLRILSRIFSQMNSEDLRIFGEKLTKGQANAAEIVIMLVPIFDVSPELMALLLRKKLDDGSFVPISREWVESNCDVNDLVIFIEAILETTNFGEIISNFRKLGQKVGLLEKTLPPSPGSSPGTIS
jgi:hypothetical protein